MSGLLAAAAIVTAAAVARAQPTATTDSTVASTADTFPRGRIVERVRPRSDPRRDYALYLPAGHTTGDPRPVLFVLDPRGRALVGLRCFVDAAERHGWIALSSWHSASDTSENPNPAALDAMLIDVQRRFAIDGRRLYLAGFSGTARFAWAAALELADHVAGVIGFGGGLPADVARLRPYLESAGFAFYGAAGRSGFNHDEMRRLDEDLDAIGLVHRIDAFDGPHGWPPVETCAHAVRWLELRAARSGLASEEADTLARWYADELAAARGLEEAGRALEALRRFRSIERDFAGLVETAGAERAVARLEGSDEVARQREVEEELAREVRSYHAAMSARFEALDRMPPSELARSRPASLEALRVEALEARADDETDPLDAEAARRMLATAFVQTSFYLPRQALAADRRPLAIAFLEIADAIEPGHPRVCLQLARAYAPAGRTEEALDAVRCAVRQGAVSPLVLETDPDLAPLREHPGFRALLREAGG